MAVFHGKTHCPHCGWEECEGLSCMGLHDRGYIIAFYMIDGEGHQQDKCFHAEHVLCKTQMQAEAIADEMSWALNPAIQCIYEVDSVEFHLI